MSKAAFCALLVMALTMLFASCLPDAFPAWGDPPHFRRLVADIIWYLTGSATILFGLAGYLWYRMLAKRDGGWPIWTILPTVVIAGCSVARFWWISAALLAHPVAASGGAGAGPPMALTDGCYYAEGLAILKIAGSDGTVMIPGEVRKFRVSSGQTQTQTSAKFTPGFLFDGTDYPHTRTVAFGPETRTYLMQPGPVPTIRMQWVAYGDWNLHRGPPC